VVVVVRTSLAAEEERLTLESCLHMAGEMVTAARLSVEMADGVTPEQIWRSITANLLQKSEELYLETFEHFVRRIIF
jgi:hypothetical protein